MCACIYQNTLYKGPVKCLSRAPTKHQSIALFSCVSKELYVGTANKTFAVPTYSKRFRVVSSKSNSSHHDASA